jgi:hypothetical protein
MTEESEELKLYQWEHMVAEVLAEHPQWMAATVNAAQRGVLAAVERQQDRNADLSMGLWQALSTRPGAKRRNKDLIIEAIKASTFAGSSWAEETSKKESE